MLAAALSALGSETTIASRPLGSVKYLCGRSSVGASRRLTGPEALGIGGHGGKGDVVIGSSGSRIGCAEFVGVCVGLYSRYAIIIASRARGGIVVSFHHDRRVGRYEG